MTIIQQEILPPSLEILARDAGTLVAARIRTGDCNRRPRESGLVP